MRELPDARPVPDAPAPDALEPVPDAGTVDAAPITPTCDFVLDFRREPTQALDMLAFDHGSVTARSLTGDVTALQLYVSPDGIGVVGGNAADYIDTGERLQVSWTVPVSRVRYTVTGGIDGNGTGTLSHGTEIHMETGNTVLRGGQPMPGAEIVIADDVQPMDRISYDGIHPDSIRIGSIAYSICGDAL